MPATRAGPWVRGVCASVVPVAGETGVDRTLKCHQLGWDCVSWTHVPRHQQLGQFRGSGDLGRLHVYAQLLGDTLCICVGVRVHVGM